MSNFVALNVHRVISFASVVGSMRANITVALITSVRIAVSSVKVILNYAVHGKWSHYYPLLLPRNAQRRACWEAYVRAANA